MSIGPSSSPPALSPNRPWSWLAVSNKTLTEIRNRETFPFNGECSSVRYLIQLVGQIFQVAVRLRQFQDTRNKSTISCPKTMSVCFKSRNNLPCGPHNPYYSHFSAPASTKPRAHRHGTILAHTLLLPNCTLDFGKY